MEVSLITPSYAPDFERCKLLCQSIDRYVCDYRKHVIIVDKADYNLFKTLKNDKTDIIIKESILPSWLIKIPFSKKWWLNLKGLPVRGWILQQIVKLSVHEFVDSDAYIFADSDVTFIRPFKASSIIKEDKVRLCSMPRKTDDYTDKRKQAWHEHAAQLSGLQNTGQLTQDYISQLVCWRRDTLQKLTQQIEKHSKKPWKQVLTNTLDFSEYILYGIFAEHVMAEESGHFKDEHELCYCSWHQPISDIDELSHFLANIPQNYNSVLIQSNLDIDTDDYKNLLINVQEK